jgi:flavodoxin
MKKIQKSIALIYGSDMGATEDVAATIYEKINIEELCCMGSNRNGHGML